MLRDDQKNLGQLLETKQIGCRELETNADTMDGDIERQMEMKQRVSNESAHNLSMRCPVLDCIIVCEYGNFIHDGLQCRTYS